MNCHYISGPITGIEGWNVYAFNYAANLLARHGIECINPADNIGDPGTHWNDWMRCDIRLLLTCKAIVMLEGWEQSKGARLENHIAREPGMQVHNIGDFA